MNDKIEKLENLSEENLCEICNDKSRNKDVLCVVEEPKTVFSIEKITVFYCVT